MQSHRKICIYAGILALALVGLVMDRALRPGTPAASAAEVRAQPSEEASRPAGTVATARQKNTDAEAASPSAPSAGRWLRELPEVPEVRDLFAMTNLFPAEAEAPAQDAAKDGKDPASGFVAAHRLNGTLLDGRTVCAVVDGRVVRPGQSLDSFRLMRVEPFRATFRQGRHEAVLLITATQPGGNDSEDAK